MRATMLMCTNAGRPFHEETDEICGERERRRSRRLSLGQEFRFVNPSPRSFPNYPRPETQAPWCDCSSARHNRACHRDQLLLWLGRRRRGAGVQLAPLCRRRLPA